MQDAHAFLAYARDDDRPFVRAALRGFDAPDLGEAFYEGYQAAGARLFPALGPGGRGALAVTESGGNHPRAIRTELVPNGEGFVLRGEKSFVTGAPRATDLFVVAREGVRDDGTPKLRVVRVSRASASDAWPSGLAFTELPKTPFAPEIPHSVGRFEGVAVAAEDVLPGDGYLRYVKPFRTVEDIHVMGAIAAHLVAFVRAIPNQEERVERWLGVIAALDALSVRDPAAPGTHAALAGVLALLRGGLDGFEAVLDGSADRDRAQALKRDLALLRVAEGARKARREAAMRALRGEI